MVLLSLCLISSFSFHFVFFALISILYFAVYSIPGIVLVWFGSFSYSLIQCVEVAGVLIKSKYSTYNRYHIIAPYYFSHTSATIATLSTKGMFQS